MLDLLGLDDVTQAAYRLWLRDEDLDIQAVSDSLGQPTALVAAARDRLITLSLLVPDVNRPGHLLAVHPEAPLAQLIQDRHEQLIRQHEHLVRAHAQVGTLVTEFMASRSMLASGETDLLRPTTTEGLRVELSAMIAGARHEVLSVRTRTTLSAIAAELLPLELEALRRGVAVRTVVARPRAGLAWVLPRLEHLADIVAAGAEIRLADDPSLDITVVDRRVGVVRFASLPGGGALVIRTPDVALLAGAMFDQMWGNADPLGRAEARQVEPVVDDDRADNWLAATLPAHGLTERATNGAAPAANGSARAAADDPGAVEPCVEAAGPDQPAADDATEQALSAAELLLLALLADGLKDEAVARALGVSVRTVRRMVAELMHRLDARSRFQAALLAQRKGWL
ncbi:LuxR C-terminal-related transcriptional regulator [Pseudofrankia inefficax]|uniref:Regulatory protein LuxR n=1 Tax=Pseudofrankia inefficax (strain DSM 45817 / CECT 9037 / DDB 130130 / EuI1c) TaxID=298654 RepID=E3IZH9_PSEI1|nr:LuxR C-terminal-related transcriptional regulator [Pseudofrankia inefficax]ADP82749.1 regulatory protein LuxR [Pseudofrankia inefficax]